MCKCTETRNVLKFEEKAHQPGRSFTAKAGVPFLFILSNLI